MVQPVAVDDYNRRAIAALRHAQHLSGARSANAFARLLAERGHGSPSQSTYRRWIAGEAVVPAWALQVAADVAGTTVQSLLDEETRVASPFPTTGGPASRTRSGGSKAR